MSSSRRPLPARLGGPAAARAGLRRGPTGGEKAGGGSAGPVLTEEERLEAEGAHGVDPAGHQLHPLRVAHLRGEQR